MSPGQQLLYLSKSPSGHAVGVLALTPVGRSTVSALAPYLFGAGITVLLYYYYSSSLKQKPPISCPEPPPMIHPSVHTTDPDVCLSSSSRARHLSTAAAGKIHHRYTARQTTPSTSFSIVPPPFYPSSPQSHCCGRFDHRHSQTPVALLAFRCSFNCRAHWLFDRLQSPSPRRTSAACTGPWR